MKFKIWYLDDERQLCINFMDEFSTPDVEIKVFTDPKEAIDKAKTNPPNLFFIDYRLPATTGDQVAQVLDPKIPKVLVTGDMAVETQYKFVKVLSKPYKSSEVSDIIETFREKLL